MCGLRVPRGLQHPLKRGYNICRIYKKVQIIKNSSLRQRFTVNKMPLNSTTYNILQFSKGVLGLSLHLHLNMLVFKIAVCCSAKCSQNVVNYC